MSKSYKELYQNAAQRNHYDNYGKRTYVVMKSPYDNYRCNVCDHYNEENPTGRRYRSFYMEEQSQKIICSSCRDEDVKAYQEFEYSDAAQGKTLDLIRKKRAKELAEAYLIWEKKLKESMSTDDTVGAPGLDQVSSGDITSRKNDKRVEEPQD